MLPRPAVFSVSPKMYYNWDKCSIDTRPATRSQYCLELIGIYSMSLGHLGVSDQNDTQRVRGFTMLLSKSLIWQCDRTVSSPMIKYPPLCGA